MYPSSLITENSARDSLVSVGDVLDEEDDFVLFRCSFLKKWEECFSVSVFSLDSSEIQ